MFNVLGKILAPTDVITLEAENVTADGKWGFHMWLSKGS